MKVVTMATRTYKLGNSQIPRKFEELNAFHTLRPIHDRIDLENAQEIVDRLALLTRPTKDQRDYLETLSTLIEKYEAENDAIDLSEVTPLDVLKQLMSSRGMNASDLGRMLGERSLGQKVLSGARRLSQSHIKILA